VRVLNGSLLLSNLTTSLLGLRVCDLVDGQTNAALGNDIGGAIANLDTHDSMRSIDAHHWEEVHDGVCAPADHCHHLCGLDLGLNDWVSLTVCGFRQANEELIHDVQEEEHGNEPAHPTWGEVANSP